MKILVTGAYGFFGTNLTKYLYENLSVSSMIYRMSGKNGIDLKNEEQVKSFINDYQPDIIVHLAANPRGNADISAMDDNCKSTLNLVHYAPQGCHFIFASSIVVYGDYNHFKFLEDMTPKPTSLYALSKLNAENIINRYARIGKIKKTNLRFCALVGGLNMSHGFVYDLTKKLEADSSELELIGTSPGSRKPFLHIDDACNVINFAIENRLDGTYNVCPQDNISVEEVAKIGMNILNKKKNIKWRPDQVWVGDNQEIAGGNCKIYSQGFEFKYKTSRAAIEAYFNELSKQNI